MVKIEYIDSELNNYIIVDYVSQVFSHIVVSVKMLFESDYRDFIVDSGYAENEYHSSESRMVYVAYDFEIDSLNDSNGDAVEVSDSDLLKIHNEANDIFQRFKGEEYDDILYSVRKKFKIGGKVGKTDIDITKIFANPQKFMKYDGGFLYPPRIEHKLQPISLDRFDNNQYVGQPKLNGSNTSVTISENSAIAKERHNTFFANPPKFDFQSLHRGKGFMCITGEFMNKSKKDGTGKPFRGFCIWDIIAYDGKILVGSTIEERIQLLDKLYPSKGGVGASNGIDYLHKTSVPDIYKVANFYGNFSEIYKDLSKVDMVEGFVLKRKSGKLEMMSREQNNTGWAVKVRKPTLNYHF